MLKQPAQKYHSFQPIHLPHRTWPSQVITHPPIWLSTDLRDGNQSLAEPMDLERKLRLFQALVQIGFKEIEVGFPSASETEFGFVRHLIEQDLIPADVTIQVLTQSREHLIRRTFESLKGVKQAIVHVYNATAPNFRRIVFGRDRPQTIELATQAAQLIRNLAKANPQTDWYFQYSPEVFTATELEFSLEICDAVLEVWEPTPDHKAIVNLPASVEVSTPNIFADQVEWMHRHLKRRDSVVLSVHNHNDRGTSTAAAELAQLAGADRVEGCLFGNGERTGNVDLVTLAMNLYTQGIHPGLDFSNLDEIAEIAKDCTQLPIHPRHPYVGELVYTAFSGSHQDAIKKGLAVQAAEDLWKVPYLPMDPADVGRTYEALVRVNSQSGKGGIAFLLEQEYGLVMPRPLQVEFSQCVQQQMDRSGSEMTAVKLWQLFQYAYVQTNPIQWIRDERTFTGNQQFSFFLKVGTRFATLKHQGDEGPVEALVAAIHQQTGLTLQVESFEERSLSAGSNAEAIAFVHLTANPSSLDIHLQESLNAHSEGSQFACYGAGLSNNVLTASYLAIMSALNRLLLRWPETTRQEILARLVQVEHQLTQS